MIVIKVWCLPKLCEEDLQRLHEQIFNTVVQSRFGLVKSRDDLLVLFPADSMIAGLGEEILLEVSGLSDDLVLRNIALDITRLLERMFSSSRIYHQYAASEAVLINRPINSLATTIQ